MKELNIKLLSPLENRMYLYFCGKNINNIKYNTRKMVVLNRLNFFSNEKGIDGKLLGKIKRRKKKFKQYILKGKTNIYHVGDDLQGFTNKEKWSFIKRILLNYKKCPTLYNVAFKKVINEEEVNLTINEDGVLILSWYSEKALLKNLLLKLNIKLDNYENIKVVFSVVIEIHYWSKNKENIHLELSMKCNRVKIIVVLPKIYRVPQKKLKYINLKNKIKKILNLVLNKRFKELDDERIEKSIFWYKSWVQLPGEERPVWQ